MLRPLEEHQMLWILVACNGSGLVSDDSAALAAEVATVIEVSFTLSDPADVHVTYSVEGGGTQSTPTRSLAAGDHMTRILGVPPVSDVTWGVIATADGESGSSDGGEIRTGNIPSSIPTFNVDTHDPTKTDEEWLIGATLSTTGSDVQFIINRDGDVVWYHETGGDLISPWTEPPNDGDGGVLYNEFQEDFCTDVGVVKRLDMSGELMEEIRTVEGHHVFVQHEDGTIAYAARDVRDHEDYTEPVCGDAVVEIAPDGTNTTLISTWDLFELVHNAGMDHPFYCNCLDWTHANMLSWNPDRNTYLFSLANLDTIVEFDRDSGEVVRLFGGEAGAYEFDPKMSAFNHQHGGHFTDEGTLLLTQTTQIPTTETTAVEFEIDDDAQTLTKIWSYGEDLGLHAMALGEPHRLDNKNTLVNFGSKGTIHEVTGLGEVVWEVSLDVGTFLGRTQLFDDIYSLDTE